MIKITNEDNMELMARYCDDHFELAIVDPPYGLNIAKSGSLAIACHNLKYDLTACELDKDYYEAAIKRLKQHQSQLTLFQ